MPPPARPGQAQNADWRRRPGAPAFPRAPDRPGKAHAFEPLRAWFGALYEVLLGQSQGPRFGSFAALFGCAQTAAMIRGALKGDFVK